MPRGITTDTAARAAFGLLLPLAETVLLEAFVFFAATFRAGVFLGFTAATERSFLTLFCMSRAPSLERLTFASRVSTARQVLQP